MFFEDWFGIGIHYDFQYVFLKGFNMYHSLWILSRFLLNLKLLDIILILIIGRTLSPYFTEIIIYKVSLLWSKERIPTPSLQAKMHHAHASCEARFRLLTYSLLILQLFQVASVSIASIIYLKDDASIAIARMVDRYVSLAFVKLEV